MHLITIDIRQEKVTLKTKGGYSPFGRQWVEFYLALAFRLLFSQDSPYLEAQELWLLRSWSGKRFESVGKEVARHLKALSGEELADLVLTDGITRRWRLNASVDEISFAPSMEHCVQWLRERKRDISETLESLPETLLAWLKHTTRAVVCLEEGKIEEGLRLVSLAKEERGGSILLGAIAELVEIRLRARIGDYPLDRVYLNDSEGKIGMALALRADFAQALEPYFDTSGKNLEHYKRLAARMFAVPDINGLGTAYNALGVLSRRGGNLDQAQIYLRYAIALLIASFDLPTLQAALFNLGHTLYKSAQDERGLHEALELIILDREICWKLGIGKDSAQAEVVAGVLCLKLGKIEEAESWLQRGQAIVATLNSDYNKACVQRLHARILWVQDWNSQESQLHRHSQIVDLYQESRELLLAAGFTTEGLDSEIAVFRSGIKPKWCP